ncbi:sulfite exporter TauE/SafE family protein [Campylobacter sp. TTU-622]|uniref:sulfite exporter TauE/SafE family protein n=1 Tax=unclassified Campylobacter TaxID=2593542 RepID=UPI0019048242|nr:MULTISPECIES: sulfite exporter TauE/SafE family protein [unclassified Campylobacter]MBK1972051.1 sulfite exporter TauE/SafE family protein [Campylobacter sp. TTU_617]MBK1972830.1 sulfite exporter TauE/SafE family protein [Campylobacter sp. TTU-622]
MNLIDLPYFAIGIISGVASGLFGIGGGMIIVPTMLILGASSHSAIGISVLQMIFAAIFGSYLNYKKKNLNLKDGIYIGLGGLLGASFSGTLLKYLSDISLTSIFLGVSCIFFLKYAFGIKENVVKNNKSILQKNIILFIAGTFTGVFAISLGIGGGLLIAPILAYFLGYDSKKVVSLSLFFVIFASISGIISFSNSNVIDSEVIHKGIIVGIASMIGVFMGIKIIEKMKLSSHRKILLFIYALSIFATTHSLLRKLGIIVF